LCKETHDDVIRFAPPLVIDRPTIDWALGPITDVLNME
jgi:ornithine--oxo-acid transaminase